MTKFHIPHRGDVYWIDPNPILGREMKDRHRFVVITPMEINRLGIAMTVPVTTSGAFAKANGLTVPLNGPNTRGYVVCNQVRSFDIQARVKQATAKFIETIDEFTINEIVNHVISIIDPA